MNIIKIYNNTIAKKTAMRLLNSLDINRPTAIPIEKIDILAIKNLIFGEINER